MIRRIYKPLETHSFFIFGARGTGKSTFIQHQFLSHIDQDKVLNFDLLDEETERKFRKSHRFLEEIPQIQNNEIEWIILDEIQKLPKLLDTVHKLIEDKKIKFVLLGSSSRKLKKMGANLLAGRAFENKFFPLTMEEQGEKFNLLQQLKFGSLPQVTHFKTNLEIQEYLKNYVRLYINEEVLQEQLVRKIDAFRDFLPIMAQCNGKQLNFAKIAREAGIDAKTVEQYYLILEQTYLGFFLPAFHFSIRKSQTIHPKFYFFDLGVKSAMLEQLREEIVPGTQNFGDDFESFLLNEFYRANEMYRLDLKLSFLKTKDDLEIDLILSRGKKVLCTIEIKSADWINRPDVHKYERIAKDLSPERMYWLSRCPDAMNIENVWCREWSSGFFEVIKWLQ